MTTGWGFPDYDDHEGVHLFSDPSSGLRAVIAIHSTELGPAAGGVRFWRYAQDQDAITACNPDAGSVKRCTPS